MSFILILYTPAPLRPASATDWRADPWRCGLTEVRPQRPAPVRRPQPDRDSIPF